MYCVTSDILYTGYLQTYNGLAEAAFADWINKGSGGEGPPCTQVCVCSRLSRRYNYNYGAKGYTDPLWICLATHSEHRQKTSSVLL